MTAGTAAPPSPGASPPRPPGRCAPLPLRIILLIAAIGSLVGCGGGGGGSSSPASSVSSSDNASTPPAQVASVSNSDAPTPPRATPTPAPAPAATPTPSPTPQAGGPLLGLSQAQVDAFDDGLDGFSEVEEAPRLGPLFNGNSCAQCHSTPNIGGGSGLVETRFGRVSGGLFDPLADLGGSLQQTSAVAGVPLEVVPPEANVTAGRRTTMLFGAGLIEAIPDSDITAYAAFQRSSSPGQAGQVNFVTSANDGTAHVGRFGWKCQQATVLDFAGDAYLNEMGVSSALFPFENEPNAPTRTVDPADVEDQPDPTTHLRDIDRFAAFMRFLAPLPTAVAGHVNDDLAQDPTLGRGFTTFTSVGCAVCHRPSWTTGGSIPELAGRRVWAFSDFLLHDVGTGDGIVQGDAPANKLRTAPLMGISTQPVFLHDGSAATVEAAILRHGGEARGAVNRYNALSARQKADLLGFLSAL